MPGNVDPAELWVSIDADGGVDVVSPHKEEVVEVMHTLFPGKTHTLKRFVEAEEEPTKGDSIEDVIQAALQGRVIERRYRHCEIGSTAQWESFDPDSEPVLNLANFEYRIKP